MIKHILPGIIFSLTLLFLAACGGSGSSGSGSSGSSSGGGSSGGGSGGGSGDGGGGSGGTVFTTAILKINLSGALGGKSIAGISFKLTLPTNITPATVNSVVATGVVTPSGAFAGSSIAPIVTYTPPGATSGAMQIVLSSSLPAGVTTIGEVAIITLQLANGATPAAANFDLTSVNVIDTFGASVSGMSASVGGVTLQ